MFNWKYMTQMYSQNDSQDFYLNSTNFILIKWFTSLLKCILEKLVFIFTL